MKVYICLECDYDYCNQHEYIVRIVSDEMTAMIWCDEFKTITKNSVDLEWRAYEEWELE